jgi:hypothetical protein
MCMGKKSSSAPPPAAPAPPPTGSTAADTSNTQQRMAATAAAPQPQTFGSELGGGSTSPTGDGYTPGRLVPTNGMPA